MDKPKKQISKAAKTEKQIFTAEATAFLRGLFTKFQQQATEYQNLTMQCLSLEAQLELAEKMLCLTRDHLQMTVRQTENAIPGDWESTFQRVRFVGVRLADACKALLQEHTKMTPENMLEELNEGMFRFRTNSPLREIHAALLKQKFVKKVGSSYSWVGGKPDEAHPPRLSLHVMKPAEIPSETKGGATLKG